MSKFIVIEGPEGSGKTTIANMVVERLQNEGYKVVYSREPGGIKISEKIRNIILDKENTEMDSYTEALLYAAARSQHVSEHLKPLLNDNYHVICDRYIDSSLAYQGHARGLGIENIYQLNQFAIQGLMPDITIFFDIDPSIGLKRITNRENDRLDVEGIEFHELVYQGYQQVFDLFTKNSLRNINTINANKSIEEVFNDTYLLIKEKLDA